MLFKCPVVRHTFYGSLETQNSMLTFIFKFDPRKGQLQVNISSIRSYFKTRNRITKVCLSYAVFSQDSKKKIIRHLEIPKITFQKCDVITLTFFGHCTSKNKDIGLKFCLLVVCMYFDHIHPVFLDTLKMLGFIGKYF